MSVTMTRGDILLSIDNIEVTYGTGLSKFQAVKDFSLTLHEGESVALVGESGCGKSTLALAILGYLGSNGNLTAGAIQYKRRDVGLLTPDDLRNLRGGEIAMVYQEPSAALNPSLRIGDQLAEVPMLHRGVSHCEAMKLLMSALEDVQLPDGGRIARSYPHQLSGGQLQRCVIAMALLGEPSLILMDEPTTALDPTVQAEIMGLIADIRRRRGTAILFISHNLALVRNVCDRVVVMKDGAIVEEGTVEAIYGAPSQPQTRRLLDAIPDPRKAPEGAAIRPGEIIIEIADLAKRYPVGQKMFGARAAGNVTANHHVSLTVRRGEAVAIVGESGGGKTTLAKILTGLETATSGTIRILGQEVGKQSVNQRPPALLRSMQMVFQNPGDTLNPARKIAAQLTRVLKKLGGVTDRDERSRRVTELLASVRLEPEIADRYPRHLSGGQKQRAAIARALAVGPDVIVADEPLSALDVSVQAVIIDIFQELRRRGDLTLIFISHDLGVVRQLADRVIVMRDACIVEQGSTEEIFSPPHHPYTEKLLAAAPMIGDVEPR